MNYNDINGPSYIGNPQSKTVMYITKKIDYLVDNLLTVSECLVFAENGIVVPEEILSKNKIIFAQNPQREYAQFAQQFENKKREIDRKRKYTLTEGNYYIGENVTIGENSYIEPNCMIGHDVEIGANVIIMSGAVIKNAVIGSNCIINENAVIGAYGFTMSDDEKGNKIRIPSLGKVIIGNNVEIGALDNISVGSGGNTVIEEYAKIDALVHIGHDARICKNVEITAGAIIGGFSVIGEETFVGINSSIRNRISLGEKSLIGMGSTVTKKVPKETVVIGNPARPRVIKE